MMTGDTNTPSHSNVQYEIVVQDVLDDTWAEYFDQMEILVHDDGTTTIRCPSMDQALLHGLLARVRDLGLTLQRVERILQATDHEPY